MKTLPGYLRFLSVLMLLALQLNSYPSFAQLFIQTGAILTSSPNATITLQNADLINNGQIMQPANSGKFVFAGSSNNKIDGSSITTFNELDLSKASGSLIYLNQDIKIWDSIQFSGGLIDLNSRNIFLQQPNTVLINENEDSHITGLLGGSIQISDPSVSNPAMFDLGNLGVAVTSSQNLGAYSVTRKHLPVSAGGHTSIQRTFFLSAANNSHLNATLRFFYLNAELNGKDSSSLGLWKSTDGNTWVYEGADNRDLINKYVEKTAVTDFSYWTLSDADDPLPLTLLSFKAVCESGYALLEWTTINEVDIEQFIVQKSTDGLSYSDVGNVIANDILAGSSYSWRDINPSAHAYYRLKITNINGGYSFSPVFSGGCDDLSMPLTIYPNPASDEITVRLSVRANGNAQLILINMSGQVLEQHDWNLQTGINSYSISSLAKYPSGTYVIKLIYNGTSDQRIFLKK